MGLRDTWRGKGCVAVRRNRIILLGGSTHPISDISFSPPLVLLASFSVPRKQVGSKSIPRFSHTVSVYPSVVTKPECFASTMERADGRKKYYGARLAAKRICKKLKSGWGGRKRYQIGSFWFFIQILFIKNAKKLKMGLFGSY